MPRAPRNIDLHHSDLLYIISRLVSLSRQSVQCLFSFLSIQPLVQFIICIVLRLHHLFLRLSSHLLILLFTLFIPLHVPHLLRQYLLPYALLHFTTKSPCLLSSVLMTLLVPFLLCPSPLVVQSSGNSSLLP